MGDLEGLATKEVSLELNQENQNDSFVSEGLYYDAPSKEFPENYQKTNSGASSLAIYMLPGLMMMAVPSLPMKITGTGFFVVGAICGLYSLYHK